MPLILDPEIPSPVARVAHLTDQAITLARRLGPARAADGDPRPTRESFPWPDVKPLERALRGCTSIEQGVEVLVARAMLPQEGIEAEGRHFLVRPGSRHRLDVGRYADRVRTFWGFSGAPLPPSLPTLARYACDPTALVTAELLAREAMARFEAVMELSSAPLDVLHETGAPHSSEGAWWSERNRMSSLDALLRDATVGLEKSLGDLDRRLLRELDTRSPLVPLLRGAVSFAAARCNGRVVPRSIVGARSPHALVGETWSRVPDPYEPLLAAAELGFVPLWLSYPARDGRSCLCLWRLP